MFVVTCICITRILPIAPVGHCPLPICPPNARGAVVRRFAVDNGVTHGYSLLTPL
jgi:hypothetical protein